MSLIVFEDEHLLVVNKPAGWNTHAPAPFAGEGIYDWLKHREPRWANLAIIHRLDKETSGLLVFGKTPVANKSLTDQFTNRAIKKKYMLLTDRSLKQKTFTATSMLVRVGDRYVSRPAHPDGVRAETKFNAVAADTITTVEAEPITGRTHQIRVHAAEHGFAILGDTLYGGTEARRVLLHAREIAFAHPATGEPLRFDCPPHWEEQRTFIDSETTNAFRLVHGASDRWSGLYIDKLGDFLLAETEHVLRPDQQQQLEALAAQHRARGIYHKLLDRKVRFANVTEASPRAVFGETAPERFTILENGLSFEVSFNEGYSFGLFLDQRDNRRRFLVNHVAAEFPLFSGGAASAHVLNVFAYTCAFSVAAAKAGAHTTSLDLSKKYLERGRRNFALNGIESAQHDFIYGDAFDWMRRLKKKGRVFDCIVLDPPTFSKSKESGTWRAENDYGKLVDAALPLLKSGGVLFASTNAARLDPAVFRESIEAAVKSAGRRLVQQHYVPQPPDFPISREEPAYLKTIWLRIQ